MIKSKKSSKPSKSKFQEERIQIGGIKLNVGIWPGKKTPIICLHGLSGNLHSMEGIIKILNKQGHKVITYDLRGRGHSDKPLTGYGFENHTNDLNEIISFYHLKNPILLGHSFGCMIALRYAIKYPNQIKSMVLLDGGGLLSLKKRIQILKVLKQSFDRLDVVFPNPESYLQLVKNSPLIPNWSKEIQNYFTKELHKANGGYVCHMPKFVMEEELKEMGGSIHLYKAFLQFLFRPIDMIQKIKRNKQLDFESIQIPTFILRGTKMNLYPNDDLLPANAYLSMLERIPKAKGMEIETNHYGILFEPIKERDQAILKFIKQS
ncbi:alpha/beta hydrolase [Leptospira jelokensis]|uniref:alpha/beta hydrolase n=1 Tax=Leptospira jelokensis TaxID=2484931 RepID=UPI0010911A9C|nr:alpha/beta hydrolase [Leptospira jelokensis]TGM05344.1 alpha/beta hydrolase [Leptospira jelokensis]